MAKMNGLRLGALALGAGIAALSAADAAQAADKVFGDFSYSYNTHFISYGNDVWGAGGDFFADKATNFFNADLGVKITPALSVFGNVWVEVNDNAPATIGGSIQEIDTNFGATYAIGKVTLGATYGFWHYAGDAEEILDLSLGLDDTGMLIKDFGFFPKLLWHDRISKNVTQANEGSALIFSIGPTIKLIDDEKFPLSLTIPAGVAFFLDDGFQGATSESGYAYSYFGGSFGLPLSFISADYGAWSVNFDVIGYFGNTDALPNNPEEDFVTGSVGIKLAF